MLFKNKENHTKENWLCITQRKLIDRIFVIVGGNFFNFFTGFNLNKKKPLMLDTTFWFCCFIKNKKTEITQRKFKGFSVFSNKIKGLVFVFQKQKINLYRASFYLCQRLTSFLFAFKKQSQGIFVLFSLKAWITVLSLKVNRKVL